MNSSDSPLTSIESIDQVLRCIDREIWIVTAQSQASGQPHSQGGLCATWVSASSIDAQAPSMLVGLSPGHYTSHLVDAAGVMGLHLLRPDQTELALNFALGSGRDRDKFANIDWRAGKLGAPLLLDCHSWLEVQVYARMETGDRNYYWCDVREGQRIGSGLPLREQQLIQSADETQLAGLREDRERSIALQRTERQRWRDNLPEMLRIQ